MKSSFTEVEIAEITKAAKRTFEYIACDLLEVTGGKEIPQLEVIECVVDADRLVSIGKLSRELNDRIYALSLREQNKMFKVIFPFKRYS
jgi:hypothetical protein